MQTKIDKFKSLLDSHIKRVVKYDESKMKEAIGETIAFFVSKTSSRIRIEVMFLERKDLASFLELFQEMNDNEKKDIINFLQY